MTDAELLVLASQYTLAEFKKIAAAPQYREVLRRFGSWSRAKSLCSDWSGLGDTACVYVAEVGPRIVRIGTAPRKSWLLGYPVKILTSWEGLTLDCIALEIKLRAQGTPIDRPRDCVDMGPGGYYLKGE